MFFAFIASACLGFITNTYGCSISTQSQCISCENFVGGNCIRCWNFMAHRSLWPASKEWNAIVCWPKTTPKSIGILAFGIQQLHTHTHTQHNQRNVNKCMRVYYEICVTKNLHRMIVVEIEPPTEGGPARCSINIARRCGWQTRAIFWHRQFLSLVWHNRPATMHIIKRHLSWRRDSIGCGRSTHQTRPDTHREDETMKQLCWRSLSQTNFLCINTYCMCFVWCVGSYCVFILYSSRIGLPHFHSNMEIKGFSPVLHYAELALWNEDGRLVSGVLRSVLSRRWSQHIEDIR